MPPSPTTLVATLSSLFQNLSLLLSLALIYTVARPWLRRGSPQRSAAVTGVIFGIFAIAATFAPVLLESGARFDGRNILIATSGAFGGPFSVIVSTLVFMIFRLWAGGNGLLPPFTPIVPISTGIILCVSIWFYTRVGKRALEYKPHQLALLGLYIALQSLTVNIVSAPGTARATLSAIGIPLIIGYPLATMLIGTLLVNEVRRTKLGRELRESELRFRQMAESIDQSFSLRDSKTGQILYVSPGFEKIWGRPAQVALESTEAYLQTIHPDDRSRFAAERLEKAHENGHVYEYRVVRPDGSIRYVRALSYPVVEADGTVSRVAGIAEDTTERKLTEAALRESEERFRQMAESIDQVFWLRDVASRQVVYLSPAYEKIWGRPIGELTEIRGGLPGIHPDDQARVAAQMVNLQDSAREVEYRILRPDGQERWIVSRSYPVVDADGAVRRIAGTAEDVTERHHMDEALRESQHFVERIASTVPDRIFVYDTTLGINVYTNRDVTLGLGYTSEQAQTLGLHAARDLYHPDDLARLPAFEDQQKQVRDGEALEFEYRMKQANGDWRWFINRVSSFQRRADGTLEQVIGVARDITDRKRSEEELRESQHFVEQIAGTVPDGIFVFDVREQRFVYANVGMSATIGYTPEEFEALGSRVFLKTFHPDDLPRLREWALRQRAMHDGDVEEFDYRLRHRSGETRYIVSRHSVFQRDAEGQVTQIIGVARDVTERHKIEDELEQSQHFVERIAGAVPDLLYVYDTRLYDKIFENRSVGDYLGYTPEQIALMGPRLTGQLLHPDDHAYLSSADYLERQKHLPDGEIIETEYRMKHANGEWRWLYSRDVPFLRAEDGSVLQLIGIARDITERKATEAALRQSQNFIERITNTVRDRIYVYDFNEKRSVYSNRDIGAMLGYTPEQTAALGPIMRTLMHPDDQASQVHYAEKLRQLADGETLEFEYRMRDVNGDWRWLYGHDTPFERDAEGRVDQVLGLARDITDRKHSEEKLRRYAEALERNNEELQMFAYTASHDLQEPLRKIQAFGDRLQLINNDELTDQGKDYLHRMMNAANRMQSLIQDLLAYSRITRINQPFSPVDMNAVATAVCSDLEVLIAQTEAEVDLGPLYSVEADPTQMRQLLQNLIGNAIKFRAPDRPPIVHVSGRLIDARDDGTDDDPPLYELTVTDNGIGFEEKYAERIFGMFQRLHGRNEYEGTGIGLAICRKIAERHHGTIQALGNAGQGATFVVTIPVRQPIQEEVAT